LKNVIFTVSPVYTVNTGGDAQEPTALNVGTPSSVPVSSAGNKASLHDWDLNYSVAWLISRKFNMAYSHANLDIDYLAVHGLAPVGLTLGDVHDRIDTVSINNAPNRHLGLSLAYYHRSRACCPADAQADSGDGALWSYGGVNQNDYRISESYSLGPQTRIGFPIVLFATEAYANHPIPANLVADDPLFGGTTYRGSGIYWPAYGIRFNVPIRDPKFAPWITYSRNESFLREDPAPVQYQVIGAGFSQKLSKNLTIATSFSNIHQFRQGFPLGGADTLRTTFMSSTINYTFHL
jgi:hypothetical protein